MQLNTKYNTKVQSKSGVTAIEHIFQKAIQYSHVEH